MSNQPSNKFVVQADRQEVTREPELQGQWTQQFPDTLGFKNQGGGKVPADFKWRSSPKQWQEELTDAGLRRRHDERTELPETNRAHVAREASK
jgi:hypothetical protein